MKRQSKMRVGRALAAMAVAAVLPGAFGQAVVQALGERAIGEIVRQIDDPNTGVRWLLVRDTRHPAGPGLLIPAAGQVKTRPAGHDAREALPSLLVRVIHAGDRLVVEESTAAFDARLEGIALGAGRLGQQIAVRLVLGGKVVRAQVTAPGRATLQAEGEVWR